MVQAKVEAINQLWRTLNRSDREPPIGLVAPDAALELPPERISSGPPVYYGPEGWLDYRLILDDVFAELTFEPEEFFEATDGRVLVYVTASGYGRSSGVPFEQKVAHLYEIRDGQIAWLKVFMDRAEARIAAGLTV
jgi:ketosteroid isomerase-like protein